MSYDWQTDLRPRSRTAATFLPPATVEETAWDILLALHCDNRCELPLGKLAHLASVPQPVLNSWLALLEERELVIPVVNEITREVRAALTPSGRTLLDRYLWSTNSLQVDVRH
jgi:DNA-binding MarR family transcriptional regulator